MVDRKNPVTSINALTQRNAKDGKDYSQITEKQWTVYYYLLSESLINVGLGEKHRFIYRNQLNISQASKILGINRTTFYNALPKLKKYRLIEYIDGGEYITIPLPKIYATIPKKLLAQLLYYRKLLSIDLLRTFLFFSAFYELNFNKGITIRNIVRTLGHSDTTTSNYLHIQIYMDLLKDWELIKYTSEIKTEENIGNYRIYYITEVKYESEKLNERFVLAEGEKKTLDGLTKEEEEIVARYISN